MQIAELSNLLTSHSQDEITGDVPWANGTGQQVERVMRVAQWAAQNSRGDLFHFAPAVDNVSAALAAVASVYRRQLHIIIPWKNLDPLCPLHTVVATSEASFYDSLKPFANDVVIVTERLQHYKQEFCFAFVHAPADLNTAQHDIVAVGHSWLLAVDNAAWEPGTMRAIMNARFILNRGLLIQCNNREAYLTQQG